MSDQLDKSADESADLSIGDTVNELTLLKHKADLLGVSYSNNIGAETLRERIRAKQEELENGSAPQAQANPLVGETEAPVKRMSLRQMLHRDQMKLVRLRITNMDPKKKDLPGEIFTVANEVLGTVRKYVPFGEVTEDGYHVPYWIYKVMKSRKFLNIRTFKDRRTGTVRVESGYVKEFALEVLDPLTPAELAKLATAQKAAGSVE